MNRKTITNREHYIQNKARAMGGSDAQIIDQIQHAISDGYWGELVAILYEENQDMAFQILVNADFDAVIEPMIVFQNQA